ncbi:MAG: hypothetical protein U9N39_08585 [Campylobacterota bacterium]|nr:hypothetical protein [Campylobacterota bacterium]
MELKYVGDLPKVSKHGVSFDHSRPDKYTYLQAAAELLEALSYGATRTTQHLYNSKERELSSADILKLLKKHIKEIEKVFDAREDKAAHFVDELKERVHDNEALTEDEKTAWLGNIKLMKDYFFQYVANDSIYKAALNALGDEIDEGKIEEVSAPMFKNYAMVLNDLVDILERRKIPIDAEVEVHEKDEKLIGTLHIRHS